MLRTLLIIVALIFSACNAEKSTPPQKAQSTGHCGRSTLGICASDAECRVTGCSGQVCQSIKEEPMITTCEWRECYDAAKFGVRCGCFDSKCQWK